MKAAHVGLVAFLGFSLALMGTVAWLWGGPTLPASAGVPSRAGSAHEPMAAAVAASAATAAQAPTPSLVAAASSEALVRRLAELIEGSGESDDDELARVERELLARGEQAGPPLVALLRREGDEALRNRLLDFLRQVPGEAAEGYFIELSAPGAEHATRAIAMDALADRRSDAALQALDHVARTDPELPSRPFLAEPRQPDDDSIELPDEAVFTPRMKAMAALASTEDPRVIPVLVDVLRNGREESLRMEAARNLQRLRGDPNALDALLGSLASEPSAYVRLAALHSLEGSFDPRLPPLLSELARRDPDRGVQVLARRLLATFSGAPP